MDDVSTLLHAAVDGVPVRPLNPAALRSRVRRSRLALAVGVATLAVVATATVALAPRRDVTPATHPWRATCPMAGTRVWGGTGVAGLGPKNRMVPSGTRRVLACRYSPFPEGGIRPYDAAASTVLTSKDPRYQDLVGLLNAVPPPQDGVFHCLADRGEHVLLLFERPGHDTVAVTVDTYGCQYVRNGTRAGRLPGQPLHVLLAQLVGE